VRLPASGYPPADLSYFPDPVSRLVDEERRRQFMRERLHYESEYALLVQYTPPLRRKSKVADIIYDDDPAERVCPAGRILEPQKKLHCPQVASAAVDECRLGSAQ
jgi:type IV secretory pathway VirB4 component